LTLAPLMMILGSNSILNLLKNKRQTYMKILRFTNTGTKRFVNFVRKMMNYKKKTIYLHPILTKNGFFTQNK
jgi:hypothetical protein